MSETISFPTDTVLELGQIKRKMQFSGKVIKITLAGAVVDIGAEIPGVVHISQLQKEPVNRVEDVLTPGDTVEVWVRRVVPEKKRLELTMIKPLDLEWREIRKDMVVRGKVTRLEKFGAFVDIGAERPAMVHVSEMTHEFIRQPQEIVREGDEIEAKVINVDRKKKQIKLSMKALEPAPQEIIRKAVSKEDKKEELEEVVPTAMEIALREAMERSREKRQADASKKTKSKSKEKAGDLEDILNRTLDHRVRTHN